MRKEGEKKERNHPRKIRNRIFPSVHPENHFGNIKPSQHPTESPQFFFAKIRKSKGSRLKLKKSYIPQSKVLGGIKRVRVYFFLAGSPAFFLAVPRTFFCLFFLSFRFLRLAFSTLVARPDLTSLCLGSNLF